MISVQIAGHYLDEVRASLQGYQRHKLSPGINLGGLSIDTYYHIRGRASHHHQGRFTDRAFIRGLHYVQEEGFLKNRSQSERSERGRSR